MINFTKEGIYGDKNMPPITEFKSMAMGVWVSPTFDISPAFDVIGEIKSGRIGTFSRPIDGNEVEVVTSIDNGETWQKAEKNIIQDAEKLNDNPYIQLRVVIRSYISQIVPEKSPKLFSVTIILSNKDFEEWSAEIPLQLKWGDNR